MTHQTHIDPTRPPVPRTAPHAGIDAIRAAFPALRREVAGRPVAYFDGPGGTQVPTAVADAVRSYLLEHNANAGWNYPTSHETDAILAAGRAAFADFFGGRADEVAFGQNMTTLTLRVSRALGRSLRPGDPVVVTELDHHANVDPWLALAAERGAEIRVARLDPDAGTLDMDDLERKIAGARVLAIGAASNALGTMPDVAAAAARAAAAGAVVFVDAVHFAPHTLPDVTALGADFVVVSPYKFYGPHLGVLWGKRERIEALELPRVASAPDDSPARIETGTLSFEAIAGATAAIDFLAGLAGPNETAGPDETAGPNGPAGPGGPAGHGAHRRARLAAAYAALHERGERLFCRLWDGMGGSRGVRVHGPPPGSPRTPTLAFSVVGIDPVRATADLARQGVFITHGDFYATTVAKRLGYGEAGLLRAGCVAYTTEEEVDRLVAGVRDLG
jgi:cysteine desulfurase family protein (TIGR01976 family)